MRAWQLHDTEGPQSYRLDEVDRPEPGPGEVRVQMRTAALNHLDLWVSRGLPKPRHFPHIAGGDGAGVIDATGPGVESVAVGAEVVINPSLSCGVCAACLAGEIVFCPHFGILGEHHSGTLAEYTVVPARNVVARPDVSWEVAGSYGLVYGTAYRMLHRARLAQGETLLVVGIGGGVATAAFELGQAMGAEVMVTSRQEEKRAWALSQGAIAAVDSHGPFAKELPRKADVVIESVGPATFDQSIRSTAPGGRIAVCGATSGTKVEVTVPVLFFKQLEIIGSTMFTHADFARVTALVDTGRIRPQVDRVFDFADLPKALARLEAGDQLGKIAVQF